MKQTAVEFLLEKLEKFIPSGNQIVISIILEQAKEMEKQQIMDAYWDGGQDIPLTEGRCEQYYNKTI